MEHARIRSLEPGLLARTLRQVGRPGGGRAGRWLGRRPARPCSCRPNGARALRELGLEEAVATRAVRIRSQEGRAVAVMVAPLAAAWGAVGSGLGAVVWVRAGGLCGRLLNHLQRKDMVAAQTRR
jgi:hypothetical protein